MPNLNIVSAFCISSNLKSHPVPWLVVNFQTLPSHHVKYKINCKKQIRLSFPILQVGTNKIAFKKSIIYFLLIQLVLFTVDIVNLMCFCMFNYLSKLCLKQSFSQLKYLPRGCREIVLVVMCRHLAPLLYYLAHVQSSSP